VAADLLNDRVIPFFDEHGVPLSRILTDRGTEYCGAPERHEYELYLAVENIDHTRTKVKSQQTNGIVEHFHKTVLNEFYRVAFRRKIYRALEELQADLDQWLMEYNEARPHQGAAGATARPRCKPLSTRQHWPRGKILSPAAAAGAVGTQ
jgi:transposase InsO family protein